MANNKISVIMKFLVIVLTLLITAYGAQAVEFRSGCRSLSDGNFVSCSWNYGGTTYNYNVGGAVPQTTVSDNTFFNIPYSATGHQTENRSLFFDSRITDASCLDANGCDITRGNWRTYCYQSDTNWHVCYIYYQGSQINYFYVNDLNSVVTFVPYLSPTVNAAPVFGGLVDKTYQEDTGMIASVYDLYDVVGDDSDSDSQLTFTITSQTNSALINCYISSNRYVSCNAPAANQFGTNTITIRATDSQGASRTDSFSVIINPVNDAPVLSGILDQSVNEDSGLSNNLIDLYSYHNDIDGSDSATTFSILSQSGSGVINCVLDNDRYLDCTTIANQYGTSDVTIQATDSGSLTSDDTFRITVTSVNDAPVLSGIPDQSVNEDSGLNNNLIDLYAYHNDIDGSDAATTYSVLSQTNSGIINCVVDSNRYIDCTTISNQYGISNVTIRATDSGSLTSDDSFNITVVPVNDAPTTPTSLSFNDGIYGNTNNTISFTCSGSTDVDSTLYYNIETNITGVWTTIVQNDSDGIYNYDISGYNSIQNIAFRCQATDLSLTSAYYTSPNSIEIDDTPPSVSSLIANDISYGNNNQITVDVTDTNNIGQVILEINNTTNYTMTLQSGNTFNYTLISPNIGNYNLTIYATDIYGNLNDSITGSFNVTDSTAPNWNPAPTNQITELGQQFIYDVNATDLQTITYSINNTINFAINNSGSITNITNLNLGTYQLQLNATDTNGNTNSTNINVIVQDTIAPNWNPTPTNQIAEIGTQFIYDVNATDLQTITYAINDTTNFAINSSGAIANATELSIGLYVLTINATDASLNTNSTTIGIAVIDTTIPQVFNLQTGNTEYNNNVTIRVNATDLSGIDTIILELDSTTNYTMVLETGDMYNYTLISPAVGVHNVRIYVNDTYGNRNDSIIGDFNITDTIAPRWSPNPNNQTIELGSQFIYDVNATDLQSITYSINDTANFAINSTGTIINITNLNLGVYEIELNATDTSSNTNSTIISITVQDTIAPKWNPIPINQTIELGQQFLYDTNATDLQLVIYAINNTINFVINATGAITNITNLNIGTYELELNATDSNTNTNTTIFSITVQDTTVPSLFDLIAADVEFDGNITFIVNVTDLSSIDDVWLILSNTSQYTLSNTGGNTYEYELDSPTINDYNFAIYANDTYSNQANISGNFTVSDTTIPNVTNIQTNSPIEYNGDARINVTITDLNLDTILVGIGGVNYTMSNLLGDIYNITISGLNIGTHPFTIYANDTQNNLNNTETGSVTVQDTTAPAVFDLTYNTSVEYNGNVLFFVNVTDLSSISNVYLDYLGTNYSMSNLGGNTYNYTLISPNVGINQSFIIYAIDNQANINNSITGLFNVTDSTAPSWNPAPTNQITELGQQFIYDVNATDLQTITYSINNTINFAINNSGSITNITNLNLGTYQLQLNATDTNGNTNSTNINVTVQDTIAPNWNPIPTNQIAEIGTQFIYDVNATDLQTITYAINDTTNFAINSSGAIANATELSIGLYVLTINATDASSNTNSTTIGITVIDTTIPQVFALQSNNVEFNNNNTIRVNATDISGIDSVILELDGTTNYTMNLENGDMYNYTLVSPSVGTHNIRIYVNDTEGNQNNSITGIFDVTETTNPSVTNIQTNSPIEYNGDAKINVTVNDLNLDAILLGIGGVNYTMTNLAGNIYNATISGLTIGTYPFTIYANDTYNNLNNSETGSILIQDTTIPSVTNLVVNNVEFNNNNNINITVTDLVGVHTVILELDGTTNYTMTNLAGDIYNYTLTSPSVGVHNIRIYTNDTSNNQNNSVTGSFTVTETTNPSVTNIQTNSPIEYNGDARINATVTDLNLDTILLEIDGVNYTMTNLVGDIYNQTITGLSIGTYPFAIYANDTYNNLNDSETGSITIQDTTAPVWNPNPTNQILELGTALAYDVNATDLQAITYDINDTSNFKINGSGMLENNTELVVGIYELQLNASDGTNDNLININITVIDTINPAVFGLIYNASVEYDANVEFYINVTDLSVVSNIYLEYSGTNYSMINFVGNQYNYTLVSPNVGNNQAFIIYAIDAQGNLNDSITGAFDVTEITAPSVTNIQTNSPVEYNADARINVTVNDLNLDTILIEIDGINHTMTNLAGNIYNQTITGLSIGTYPFTIYANDTYNNLNNSETGSIVIQDTIAPKWTPIPTNQISELETQFLYDVNATDLQTITYSINDTTNFAINGSGAIINATELSIGLYVLTINATDASGNVNSTTIEITIIDTNNPSVTNLIANNVEFNNNNTIRVDATDVSGIDTVILELDSTINYTMVLEAGTTYNYTLISPSVGTHNIRIYVNDIYGNRNYSITETFNVTENTAPSVTSIQANSPVEYNGDARINATVTDLNLDTILLEIDGVNYTMTNLVGDIYNQTITGLSIGTYPFAIYANDTYNNLNDSETGSITIQDTTAPVWNPNPTNQNVELGQQFIYDVNATDLQTVFYQINDTTNFAINTTGAIINITNLNLGTYKLRLNASDIYNDNFINMNVTVVDTTNPSVTNLIANNVEFNNNNYINVTVTDLAPIDTVILELNGNTNYTMTNIVDNIYNLTLVSPAIGVHTIRIYTNDTSNNQNNSVTGSFTVTETTNPSVTNIQTNSPVEYNGDARVNVTVTDLNLDTILLEIDGVNYTMTNLVGNVYNQTISGLTIGTYPFTVYANDTFNNLNDTETGSITISDTSAPSVFNLQLNNIEYNNNLTIRVNATDILGIDSVILELDGTTNYTMAIEAGNRYNYTLISPSIGTHNIRIYANDTQSNLNYSITGSFNVTDSTAPNWNPLPTNQNIELGSQFSYDVDATDLQTITYSINNTNNFTIDGNGIITNTTNLQLGTYQLQLNASDGTNDNLTNINVTVVDTTAPVWSPIPSNQNVEYGVQFSYDIDATDLQTITYSINNTNNFTIDANGIITNITNLQIGTYKLQVNATDSSANILSTNINVSIIDNIAPSWTPIPTNQNIELGNQFGYDVNSTDLQTITYSINNTINFAINSAGYITNITNLNVGTYKLQLNASDGFNNNLTNINVTVQDTTSPAVFDLTHLSTIEYNNNLTIKVNVTDLATINSVLLEYLGTNYSMNDEGNDRYNYTLISPNIGNSHTINIYAIDTNGNTNDSVIGTFNVTDSTIPIWNPTPTNQNIEIGNSFSYDTDATDLQTITYSVNNTVFFSIDTNGILTNTTQLAIGTYKLQLNASDGANDNLTNINITVVDTRVPQVTNSVIPLTVLSNESFNITVDVFDYGTIDTVIVDVNGTNYTMSLDSGITYNLTLTNLAGGVYIVRYYANDTQGNLNDSITDSFSVVTVNTAPTINLFTPASQNINEGEWLNITINATDTETTPIIRLYINETQVALANANILTYNRLLNNSAQGTYNYTACATDGILTNCLTRIYTIIDATIPDLSNVSPTGTLLGSSQRIVIYPDRSINDSNVILEINSNPVAETATSTNITYSATNLPEGVNTINVTATDLFGNTNSYQWSFIIDITSIVSGFVLDTDGVGVSSAQVQVEYLNGTIVDTSNTFVNGQWQKDFTLTEGNYTFRTTAPNYITNATNLSVDGSDLSINFTLIKKPNIRVDSLTHNPDYVVEYQDIVFTAELSYEGHTDDNVDVYLYRNSTLIDTVNLAIDKNTQNYTVNLDWENATIGTYDFTVNVSALDKETYLSDNEGYDNEITTTPIEDVLSLGIRGVPTFDLPVGNFSLNVYTDVISSATVDLYNIPLKFVNSSGITLNTAPSSITFNIDAGDVRTDTWNIKLGTINSTLNPSNVTAQIYSDIFVTKNISSTGNGGFN